MELLFDIGTRCERSTDCSRRNAIPMGASFVEP